MCLCVDKFSSSHDGDVCDACHLPRFHTDHCSAHEILLEPFLWSLPACYLRCFPLGGHSCRGGSYLTHDATHSYNN